jgi:hypothetical protein
MRIRTSLVFLLCAVSELSFAADTTVFHTSIGFSVVNNDNVYLSNTYRQSDNIYHSLFDLNYKKNSPVIDASLTLHVDHQDYQKNSYPDQTVISSRLDLNAILAKNRLTWDVLARTDRVKINANALDVPTNQENITYFETGPSLTIFNNKKHSIDASLKYEKLHSEITNIDSSAYFANVLYKNNVTRTFLAGINTSYLDKNYDDPAANVNYKRTDISINLNKRTKLSETELDMGGTRISPQGQQEIEHSLFKASYKRQLGYHYQMTANYESQLGDFTDLFAVGPAGSRDLASAGSNIFMYKKGILTIAKNARNSAITYEYTHFSNEYSDAAQNVTTNMGSFAYANRMSPGLNLNLGVSYSVNEYAGARRDLARIYLLGISRVIQGQYDINFSIQYTNMGSNDAAFAYDDRLVTISGHYFIK